MGVGDENTIDLPERLWQDLLTEIRSAINEQTRLCSLYQYRTACTFVLGVCTLTDLTLATDHWHTTRCSRTQKSQLHFIYDLRIYGFTIYHLNDIHFRIYFDIEFGFDILADGVAEGDNLGTCGATAIYQY